MCPNHPCDRVPHPTPVRELAIGPHVFSVCQDENHDMHLKADGAKGHCHFDSLVICIDSTLPESLANVILVHEALHAIWHMAGLSALDDLSDELEELIVSALSTGIVDMLQKRATPLHGGRGRPVRVAGVKVAL